MDKIIYSAIGVLNAAAWLANVADQPTLAKDLIKAELIDLGILSFVDVKQICQKESIDLKKVFKSEVFK
jgi:hypothetical protein